MGSITRSAARRVVLSTTAIAALVLATVGCTQAEPAASVGDEILIGHAGGRTGFMEAYDVPIANFAQLAIDDINEAGGINGKMLRLIEGDMQSDASMSEAAALEVMEEGAEFVITACDFDLGGGAARAAAAAGKVAIGCGGATNYGYEGFGDAGPLVFNSWPANATQAGVIAQHAYDKGFERPFFLVDSDLTTMGELCNAVEDTYQELGGGATVGTATFSGTDQSIATQVAQIDAADPDAIFLCASLPGGASAVRQIRTVSDAAIMAEAGMEGTSWTDAVPGLSDFFSTGLADYTGTDPNPERAELLKRYEERFGALPPTITVTGYTDVQILAEGIRRAGSTEGTAVAAEISKLTDFEAITGSVTFTETCHIPVGQPMVVMSIQNGTPQFDAVVTPTVLPDFPC